MLERQPVRFVLNGIVATGVHFIILTTLMEIVGMTYAGVANAVASSVGIVCSFLGNRHFVFPGSQRPALEQFGRFWALYLMLALLQGAILWLWSDVARLDYRVGFVIATILQTICSYFGGRRWVFA